MCTTRRYAVREIGGLTLTADEEGSIDSESPITSAEDVFHELLFGICYLAKKWFACKAKAKVIGKIFQDRVTRSRILFSPYW